MFAGRPRGAAPDATADADGDPVGERSAAGSGVLVGYRKTLVGGTHQMEPLRVTPGVAVMVSGPTGSGKTTLLAQLIEDWPGPVMAISGKADLMRLTRERREARGTVWVVDPSGVTGSERDGIVLLEWCRTLRGAIEVAGALTASAAQSGVTDSAFWFALARRLIASSLFAAGVNGYTLSDVYRWVMTEEAFEVRGLLQASGDETAMMMFESVRLKDEKVLSSIYATAQQVVTVFDSPEALECMESPDIDIAVLAGTAAPKPALGQVLNEPGLGPWDLEETPGGAGPATLYATLPVHMLDDFGPLVALMARRLVKAAREHEAAGHELPAPVLLVVDEAATAALLPLQEWTATLRSSGVQVVSTWQSVGQMDRQFGVSGSDVMLENSSVVLLGGARPTSSTRRVAAWLAGADRSLMDPEGGASEVRAGQPSGAAADPVEPEARMGVEEAAFGLSRLPLGQAVVLDGPRLARVSVPGRDQVRATQHATGGLDRAGS